MSYLKAHQPIAGKHLEDIYCVYAEAKPSEIWDLLGVLA